MSNNTAPQQEYILLKLDNEGCKLIFQHLFDKGLRGEYKIILEKINE
jgi:hypothetical protein